MHYKKIIMAKEEKKNLESILNSLKKDYGNEILSYGNDKVGDFGTIPFGTHSLDAITGIGGIPKGRVTELHGMDGTFKTTFTLELARECQQQNGKVAFIDAEYAFSAEYAETLGVNTEDILLIHPASAEECFSVIERLVESKEIDLIILDSLAALSPNAELANEFGSSNMGVMARLMGQFFRKVVAKIGKTGCTLVIINQLRESLGGYVPLKTTPGGNALKFFASMRFEITKSAIKEGTAVKGVNLKVKCVKNKLATPFLTTELECIYGQGIDKLKDLIEVACDKGIITKGGAGWMTYEDVKIQGADNMKIFLLENKDKLEEIKNKLNGGIF